MKIFLSYPSTINPIVENIYKHLPQGTFDTWLDTERITAGASIPEELALNILDSEFFICFLNADAMKSESVRLELHHANAREKALGRPFIIPILVNGFPKDNLPDYLNDGRRFLSYTGTNYPRQVAAFANELTDELLRLTCQKPSLRCEGMAAVYYFSFVEPLVTKLFTTDNLVLKSTFGERSLKNTKCTVRILLPEFLDELQLDQLRKKHNLQEGDLLSGQMTIFRRLLFDRAIEAASKKSVIFYDVPNFLNSAAKLFAQERNNRDWKKLNRMELLSFKYNVERLVNKNITMSQMRDAVEVDLPPDPYISAKADKINQSGV